MITFTTHASPVGPLLLVSRGAGVARLTMENQRYARAIPAGAIERPSDFDDARIQLDEYFAGTRTRFDLALDLEGTPFQLRVWGALCAIPFGRTTSYGELARSLGIPGSSRAVGHANARNPVGIVVPCHRVIGASGALTGYAGGEDRKRWLLAHEGARGARQLSLVTPSAVA